MKYVSFCVIVFSIVKTYIVDLAIFACSDFHEFMIFSLYAKSRIRELVISMICNAIILIMSQDS